MCSLGLSRLSVVLLVWLTPASLSIRYYPDQVSWNLNQNETATHPLDYSGSWENHTFFPSPENWRFPFYTIMLDRFVNGDPTNDNINGTAWEHDLTGTQLRHGGDVQGFVDTLDYILGMGFKGIYFVGSPMINFPWGADQFSPLDLTLLEPHFATIDVWRQAIDAMHARGMYALFDNTMATLSDLIGFEGSLNVSTPLNYHEYNALWKSSRRYHDFDFNNTELEKCDVEYPRWWDDYGNEVVQNGTEYLIGCRDSEFDQYGDVAAFDVYPEWQRQISKFASVQDRLREWKPSVREKIQHLSCLQITMLDIDGFRMDKGEEITVDAQGEFADFIRQCAVSVGKTNFFIPGEIVSGNTFGSIYLGRGKEPQMAVNDTTQAVQLTTDNADDSLFIRAKGKQAFDAACFHYSTFRGLERFLGLDGNLGATGETPVDFVLAWNAFVATNDLINANTGVFDPRHMYGCQNQDNFRWPTIVQGTQKQLLGNFVTTLLMPGIPLLEWGEEQAYYALDNTASNYVFGRQPMSSATAWQDHGCYTVGNAKFATWPDGSWAFACHDEWNSLDHRDPSHPIRNLIAAMYTMRQRYPVLNDGFYLETIAQQTHPVYLPGSLGTATVTGLWSVRRAGWPGVQDFTASGQGLQEVWQLMHNEDSEVTYSFDCSSSDGGLLAPYDKGTIVRNLFYPYEEITLGPTPHPLALDNKTNVYGCIENITLPPWGFKMFVPSDKWTRPLPFITKFNPGHDARILSAGNGGAQNLSIELLFSDEMDCYATQNAITVTSTTEDDLIPSLSDVTCQSVNDSSVRISEYTGSINVTNQIPAVWKITGNIGNVSDGIHLLNVANTTNLLGNDSTNAIHHFLFRVGTIDNPMVFPRTANYSSNLFHRANNGTLYIAHKAAGADKFRYSTNWGSTWSEWLTYRAGNYTIEEMDWSGTKAQRWSGQHVQVEYWSQKTGSSNHAQQGDLADTVETPRRWPHVFIHGSFNQYGYDSGLDQTMWQNRSGIWQYNFMTEWPSELQCNVWGSNPSGQPDLTGAFGDVDSDGVLDRLSPVSLLKNVVNITAYPPYPYLAYHLDVNDATLQYYLTPMGSRSRQMAIYTMLLLLPMITGAFGVWVYLWFFYDVKFNAFGRSAKRQIAPILKNTLRIDEMKEKLQVERWISNKTAEITEAMAASQSNVVVDCKRKKVLIATMEYDIDDWAIKIKIGGLGVMAQTMSKHLDHLDLIWVVPCVSGIEYPIDKRAEPITVMILDTEHTIEVQYHKLRNITYVLLDAPTFRTQTKENPYPARMDDMDSAIYYSAWNSCIAEVIRRFPIDLYHINDYHGAVAPLHILPKVIPCCLSLHNAEFQGLWSIRTKPEFDELCGIYNLKPEVVVKYVQFGEVFNLLHAGASYLRVWQKGYGAAGVSQKYGKRSFARYPILWGLNKVAGLPNPDPTDIDSWDKQIPRLRNIAIDETFEANRPTLRRQAQEWANLKVDPDAELFVFVGRWSMQKGVDLIADVFPAILEEHSNAQLICIGPVIDLYGKFAALKLERLMQIYPNRVYSKPEFTTLPPFIFSGAEFALIPSRDEPFGLVAVEFGRKGALGVGARVGGLGNMPGWWFTIESSTTKHLISQFKMTINSAIASKQNVRATMRARAAKQRFPVAQWKEDLSVMQATAIKLSQKEVFRHKNKSSTLMAVTSPSRFWGGQATEPNGTETTQPSGDVTTIGTTHDSREGSSQQSGRSSRPTTPREDASSNEGGNLSLGLRIGPGHVPDREGRKRRRLAKLKPNSRSSSVTRPGSPSSTRPASPVQDLFKRKGKKENIISPDSETVPAVPPLLRRVHQKKVAQMNEESNRGEAEFRTRSQGDIRRLDFGSDSEGQDDTAQPAVGSASSSVYTADEYIISQEQGRRAANTKLFSSLQDSDDPDAIHSIPNSPQPYSPMSSTTSVAGPPIAEDRSGASTPAFEEEPSTFPTAAYLSLGTVLQGKNNYKLQMVDPMFTDPTGLYYTAFSQKLQKLNGRTSESALCVEEYLTKSEKDWFSRFRSVKMGKSPASTPASSTFRLPLTRQNSTLSLAGTANETMADEEHHHAPDQYDLHEDYKPPTGLSRLLMRRIGQWPLYSFLLAFGQIIAANSYQITLLTGQVGQSALKLYVLASIYLISSMLWWFVFRFLRSVYVLTTPFLCYAISFFLLGMAPYAKTEYGRGWVQNIATAWYSIASASGAFYFSLNFGSEGSVPTATWAFRACIIQGSQQIYIVALWFWGSELTALTLNGVLQSNLVTYGPILTAITLPLSCLLLAIGIILYLGLPDYYRQTPGRIPSFYRSVIRRRIVLWLFVAVIIQNYFLSAPYGRMWLYLFSSKHAPPWTIWLLVTAFFIGLWALALYAFSTLSKHHSWILPIFAISLGCPRWCQMLWGTSGMGTWVPWAGSPLAGALVGRCLWLWLGVLDAIQGVGFGMILLQTLTRFHVVFALVCAQVLGSVATIVGRATSPDGNGPGSVFPNLALTISGLKKPAFWVGLVAQLVVCAGFAKWFRREQLMKP